MNHFGMHDEEGRGIVPADGLCLALTDLSANSAGKDYRALRPDINWFVRLQWGYGTTGTIPKPERLNDYLIAVERCVRENRGVYAYLVGNEPNKDWERPDGMVITPQYYFDVYKKVVAILQEYSPTALVSHAAYAPYTADPKNWLDELKEVLSLVSTEKTRCDFINIHAYLRGSTPAAVTSDEKMMDAPLTGQYSSFRTYKDALSVVPTNMRKLRAYITECNEILEQGWVNENTGVVKAVYREIDYWNGFTNSQKIRGVFLYRWPKHDKFFIEGKQGVIDDFAEAIAESPQNAQEAQGEVFIPLVVQSIQSNPKPPIDPSTSFERDIDIMALNRGVNIEYLPDNVAGWRVRKLNWLNVQESQGRHHIYYDVINMAGNRVVEKDLIRVIWSTGFKNVDSEAKPGEPYSANFPMSSSRNDFSTWVLDDTAPSERVTGIGMGADEGSGFNASAHTSTAIEFVFTGPLAATEVPEEELSLAHPVVDPRYRMVTQEFGEHPENYKKFGVPGHNGVDFATPMRSGVQAVDEGTVLWTRVDPETFGIHTKIKHEWGESLYAHLAGTPVGEGDVVQKGEKIAESGNSGNSSGPHLHFGIRPYPLDLSNGYNGYVDPMPYLEGETEEPTFTNIPSIFRNVGDEYAIDWELLASLAWAESSFRPGIQDGLFQIGDMAWADWSKEGEDRGNPLDNARVGARYFKFLVKYYNGNEEKALQAWNFGLGNIDAGIPVPAITNEFVHKVQHGRDLLQALGV